MERLIEFADRLSIRVSALNKKIASLASKSGGAASDPLVKAEAELEGTMNDAIATLPSEVDPDTAEKINRHIQEHVKRHIKLIDARITTRE